MRAPAGLIKRYTNIAPRWCQALAAMVQPERRFLDAATAELCSGYNPNFAGMGVFGMTEILPTYLMRAHAWCRYGRVRPLQ